MRSYFFRNFISGAFAVLLCFIILGVSFMGLGRTYMINERKAGIETGAREVCLLAEAYSRTGYLDDWDFRIILSTLSSTSGSHYFLTDLNGKVMTCSDKEINCPDLGKSVDASIIERLQSEGSYFGLSTLGGFYQSTYYVAALPISTSGGYVAGYVFAGSNAESMIQVWNSLFNIFFIAVLTIMSMLLMISYVSTRHNARPINEMAAAARRFSHGDFSVRVSGTERSDEIGALASAFNEMAESLEQSEQRRSDFISNVSHELKTPMTSISGFADGILDGTIPPEKQRGYLETISSETKRLNRLVRRMLDVSRMQSAGPAEMRKKSFDAGELLLETLLVFEKKIEEKGLDVDIQLPEDPIITLGERDAINQVIYNLLENAVKFSTPGSTLGVSLFKQEDKAYISVKNHGETISQEDLARIFDRFHKTDRSRSQDRDGVGLGLYIVKTIIGSHGEDISVTSRDGITEFVFSLTIKEGK